MSMQSFVKEKAS